LSSKKYRIISHVLFWLVYLLYGALINHFSLGFGSAPMLTAVFLIDFLTIGFCLQFIVPRFLGKKTNLKLFVIYLTIAVAFNLSLNFILQNYVFGSTATNLHEFFQKQAYSFQFSFVFIGIAIGLKIFRINLINSQNLAKMENERVNTELDLLKEQINPHFLFNVLNNVYIQTRIEPAKAADMVLKLSDLLRYQLYECTSDKVMLKSEIEYLRNYVDLQKMRIANIELKFEQNGTFKGLMIYPFLLIPFLENAFKYGGSSRIVENFIHINVDIVEKYVIFAVKNSKNDTIARKVETDGKGIKNIKKRLELLYPNKYELEINDGVSNFYVELKINLE
jgi:two-component system, LytTR family, sensor kinase